MLLDDVTCFPKNKKSRKQTISPKSECMMRFRHVEQQTPARRPANSNSSMEARGAGRNRSASLPVSIGPDAGRTSAAAFVGNDDNSKSIKERGTRRFTSSTKTRQQQPYSYEEQQRNSRRRQQRPWVAAAAAGCCLAFIVSMSGRSSESTATMSVMATRQRHHPVAAMARDLFHPHARERR